MGVLTAIGATVAGLAASKMQSDAQKKAANQAAKAQVQAADQATALQREIYQDQKKLLTPSSLAGAQAEARRMLMTGSSVEEAQKFLNDTYTAFGATGAPSLEGWDAQEWLRSTPGYEFNFNEGQRAVERSAAARGGLFSGETGMELTRYGQNYADNEWDDLWNQYGELSGAGSDSTGTVVNVAGDYGDSAARNRIYAGEARASGYRAAGEADSNFWNSVGGAIGRGYGIGRSSGWFGK